MTSSRIKTIAVVPRLGKPGISSICNDLIEWLANHQVQAVVPLSDARALGQEGAGLSEDELMKNADLVVVLGGDGTILRAVRLLKGREVPVLGVNLGTFGFLAEVETAQLIDSVERIIVGEFGVEKRMMLNCEIVSGKAKTKHNALNEIFVGRGNGQRLLEFDVKINNRFFNRISCDGLILASPTGSTAYALSAGGPLVSPANQLIILVPVCPHSLFNRSLILEKTDTVEIAPTERVLKASVACDGIYIWGNKPFDYVKVISAQEKVNLVKFGQRDFYSILRKKLQIYTSFSDHESEV